MHRPEHNAICLLEAAKHCLGQMPDARLVGYCEALIRRVESPDAAADLPGPDERREHVARVRARGETLALELMERWLKNLEDKRLLAEVALEIYSIGWGSAMDAITPDFVAAELGQHLLN